MCPLQGWAAILREVGPFQSLGYLLPGTSVRFRGRGLVQSGAVSADLGSEATDNFSEFFKIPSILTSFYQPVLNHIFLCRNDKLHEAAFLCGADTPFSVYLL